MGGQRVWRVERTELEAFTAAAYLAAGEGQAVGDGDPDGPEGDGPDGDGHAGGGPGLGAGGP